VTVSSRPITAGHDRPLYGKQFCDMEFICVPGIVIEETVNIHLFKTLNRLWNTKAANF
jgi:hypothetical protein